METICSIFLEVYGGIVKIRSSMRTNYNGNREVRGAYGLALGHRCSTGAVVVMKLPHSSRSAPPLGTRADDERVSMNPSCSDRAYIIPKSR